MIERASDLMTGGIGSVLLAKAVVTAQGADWGSDTMVIFSFKGKRNGPSESLTVSIHPDWFPRT
jgi:hypothetical protein